MSGRNGYGKTEQPFEDGPGYGVHEDERRPGQNYVLHEKRSGEVRLHVQTGTENGFVPEYDIFPNPADTRTRKPGVQEVPAAGHEKTRHGTGPVDIRVQLLNNNRLKMAKYGAFYKTCSITNRVTEQVQYILVPCQDQIRYTLRWNQ
jgi:hypothetical protein